MIISENYKHFFIKELKENKMKKWSFFLLMCLPFLVSAQDSIQGKIGFYQKNMIIGQPIYLELEVKAPSDIKVQLPEQAPEIKGLESYKTPIKVAPIQEDLKTTIYKFRYPYIAFDSVSGNIGSVSVNYSDKKTSSVLNIEGGDFQVSRIPVDTSDALRAAYGPIAPLEAKNWELFFVILLVCVVLAIIVGIYQWRKRKQALTIPDNIDPRVWALSQIDELLKNIPFASPKKSWSHLSDVLRVYMKREWEISAPYFSTGEILGAMTFQESLKPQLNHVSEVLNICDEVKFARKNTSEEEQKSTLEIARKIINFQPIQIDSVEKEVKNE